MVATGSHGSLRRAGRRARRQRRFRARTTESPHGRPIAPPRLAERAQPPARPSEIRQAALTGAATREGGGLHVAGILAACRRRLVGWAAEDTRPTSLIARAFERAIASRRPAVGWLHHSDRGSQCAGDAPRERRHRHGAGASMRRAGNCCGDAKVESFRATLKTERIDGPAPAAPAKARSALLCFWHGEVFCNRRRLHSALGFYSPVGFEHDPN